MIYQHHLPVGHFRLPVWSSPPAPYIRCHRSLTASPARRNPWSLASSLITAPHLPSSPTPVRHAGTSVVPPLYLRSTIGVLRRYKGEARGRCHGRQRRMRMRYATAATIVITRSQGIHASVRLGCCEQYAVAPDKTSPAQRSVQAGVRKANQSEC